MSSQAAVHHHAQVVARHPGPVGRVSVHPFAGPGGLARPGRAHQDQQLSHVHWLSLPSSRTRNITVEAANASADTSR